MKFADYLKKVSESTATKRNVTGPYAKMMYPTAYGFSYRAQYSPWSIPGISGKKKWTKKKEKKEY